MTDKADQKKVRRRLVEQVQENAQPKKEKKESVIKTLPSNITTLDLALGGGFPIGQISNIVGDSSSGKTFLACEFIAAARYLLGDKLEWFYDDIENRFSFNTKHLYGFNIIKKDQVNSYTIEDFTENIREKLKRLKEGKLLIYVLDSFDALSSEAEVKRSEKDNEKGTFNLEKQKKLGEFFRLRAKEIKQKNCILIIISQVRENIGVSFGPRYYRTGGKALDHWASLIVWLAEVEKHRRKHLAYGITTKCRVTKVGNDKPFRECFLEIVFDYGIDVVAGNILYLYDMYTEQGKRKEKIEKELFKWDKGEYSFKGLIAILEKNNQEKELSDMVQEKWEKTESAISSSHRKEKYR